MVDVATDLRKDMIQKGKFKESSHVVYSRELWRFYFSNQHLLSLYSTGLSVPHMVWLIKRTANKLQFQFLACPKKESISFHSPPSRCPWHLGPCRETSVDITLRIWSQVPRTSGDCERILMLFMDMRRGRTEIKVCSRYT